jgi:PhnB protein
MQVQPYLFFDGRCDEALDFYKKAIGADVKMVMRWKDSQEHVRSGKCRQGHARAIPGR